MSYSYANIESRVRNNVNLQTASVTDVIDDAINLLSNFFQLKKTDTSKSTVVGQNYIDKPARCLRVLGKIKIGEDYFAKKEDSKDLQEIEEYGLQRFEETDDSKIMIFPTPTAVETCRISALFAFAPLAGAENSDVPDHLVPLLVILATWLYWEKISSQTGTQRENYPDMNPKEAKKIAESWKKQFDELYEKIANTN